MEDNMKWLLLFCMTGCAATIPKQTGRKPECKQMQVDPRADVTNCCSIILSGGLAMWKQGEKPTRIGPAVDQGFLILCDRKDGMGQSNTYFPHEISDSQ
jgi:hypothetical protein